MSYSVCLECQEIVSCYEKYCAKHEKQYQQDNDYWKTHGYADLQEPRRTEILNNDALAKSKTK